MPKSDFVEPEIEKGLDLVDGQVGGAGQAARQANAGRDRRSQRKVRPGWLRFCLRRPGCSGSCLLLSLSLFTCFFFAISSIVVTKGMTDAEIALVRRLCFCFL